MKEMEKNMMCVLLQRLLDKNLITPRIHDHAREQILATFDRGGLSFCPDHDRKEEAHGYTQNPRGTGDGKGAF